MALGDLVGLELFWKSFGSWQSQSPRTSRLKTWWKHNKTYISTGNPLVSNITCIYKQMVEFPKRSYTNGRIFHCYVLHFTGIYSVQHPKPTTHLPASPSMAPEQHVPCDNASICHERLRRWCPKDRWEAQREATWKTHPERWWDVSGDQLRGGLIQNMAKGYICWKFY